MKKLSSKIIIFLLITTFFWGGASFDFGKINKAYALTAAEDACGPNGVGNTVGSTDYTDCVNEYNADPIQIANGTASTTQVLAPVVTNPVSIPNTNTPTTFSQQADAYCRNKYNLGTGPMVGNTTYSNCAADYIDKNMQKDPEVNMWKVGFDLFGKSAAKFMDIVKGLYGLPAYAAWSANLLIIATVLNLLAYIVAGTFDAVLSLSMMSFNNIISSAGIDTAWEIIRNIINVSFVFILLYISISMILGEFGPKKKSTVAGVVVSALLINFSLFITRLIIDFGNMFAVAIYNKSFSGPGFSVLLMQGLQLQTLFNLDAVTATGQVSNIVLMVIQIILIAVFIWVLISGIIFILGRLVTLMALLALSPIGFIGLSMPWLKDKADDWWKALINQVFLLPLFLFFLMMASTLLKGGTHVLSLLTPQILDPNNVTATNVGAWVYFGLVIGMLVMSLKMTKKMSGGVGAVMDKVATGLKWATAAVVAVGASVVTGGAATGAVASGLGRMAASTGGTGLARAVGSGGLSLARSRVGQAIRTGGRAAADVVDAPGFVGDMSRALLKESLGGIKKHTGIDIEGANKELRDYQKNYNKYAGEQANKIGPGEVNAEMKNRKETMENIEAQAKNRLARGEGGKEIEKTLKDTAKEIEELTGAISGIDEAIKNTKDPSKIADLEKQKTNQRTELEAIKNNKKDAIDRQNALLDGLKKQIGQEMGYNTELHEAEMQMLGGEKIKREIALNTHLKNLSNSAWYSDKKAAETLRAIKGKYEEKSKAEKLIDDITKEAEKKAKEDAKKTA